MAPAALDLVIGFSLITLLGLLSFRARVLDLGGLITALLIGYIVFLGGGWTWLALIVAFIITSDWLTKFKYDYKKSLGLAQEKGGARGWPNALANGGIAALAAAFEYAKLGGIEGSLYAAAYLGAVAAATADTLATEVGLLSKSQPRLITDLKKVVPPGTSGGVTLLGEAASVLASLLIGGITAFLNILNIPPYKVLLLAVVGGLVGSNFDSLLGSTVQGKNLCQVCGSVTENLFHHQRPTKTLRGLRMVENNVVNFAATALGALASILLLGSI